MQHSQPWTLWRALDCMQVIVFIVGGSTFEEAKAVADWNERNPGMRVVLGGSDVLNSDMFLEALGHQYGSTPRTD